MVNLDRYYTPERVAVEILERAEISAAPMSCADSTCGSGRLLDAANIVFGGVECVGVDRDKGAIEQLKIRRPSWHLAVANMLGNRKKINRFSSALPAPIDLLFLNPPFSDGRRKSTDVSYGGAQLKSSVAMAHLLRSIDVFKPKHGAIAIVPESLLHSDTDDMARSILQEEYSLKKILDLKSCTFEGARVNSSAIQICRDLSVDKKEISSDGFMSSEVSLIRGGVPVHLMVSSVEGAPFLHSTDIRRVVCGDDLGVLQPTSSCAKGRLEGWSILIPRVGLPDRRLLKVVYLDRQVQLSDCVIAISFDSQTAAESGANLISAVWDELHGLYKGTGARYITLSRLGDWLSRKGFFIVK